MIKNKNNNKIIIKKKKFANTFFQRALGLMFSKKSNFNYGLIFDLQRTTLSGASIHMFFVFFSIHIVFLNKNKVVVDMKKDLKPFMLYNPKKASRYIIELPLKTNMKNVKIGDKLSW